MKKKLILTGMIVAIVCSIFTMVQAATPTVTISTEETEITQGEQFTIIVHASSEDGINGFNANYTYDKTQLELIDKDSGVVNASFASLSGEDEIALLCSSAQTIKNADIYKLTFKVKETATPDATLKIEFTNMGLDTDADEDSYNNLPATEVSIKVKEKVTDPEPEPQNQVIPRQNTVDPEPQNAQYVIIDPLDGKKIPNAGEDNSILFYIVGAVIIATVSYLAYKKYGDIK